MDWTSWISVLVILIHAPLYVSGEENKIKVAFDIWEGNVTVLWDLPDGAPPNALYQVKQSLYTPTKWHVVAHCNMTRETICNLGNLIDQKPIKIQVGLFQSHGSFNWSTGHRIRLLNSKLLAPDFHLSSTTKSVKVKIFRKQFLKQLFAFGPRYTVTLQPKGDSQAITQIEDDDEDGEVEFSSLQLWQEYCVRVTVEMESANVKNTSLQRCIYLSTDLSLVISMVTLCVAAVVMLFVGAICFFLRRPGKMPSALKSAVNGWHPMNIGFIQVETVTDKGWLLTSNKMAGKTKVPEEKTEYSEEDKERRESTDSGVSIGQQCLVKFRGTDTWTGEDDSGCGSLSGPEDSLSNGRRSLEEIPSLDGGATRSSSENGEDSGLGMGNQDVSESLQGADSGLLSEIVVVGDGYRSQSPSGDAQSEITIPCGIDSDMAVPSGGYRSGHVTCLCSDFETCLWCRTRKLLSTDCDSASHEQASCTFAEDRNHVRPSYLKKSSIKDVTVLGLRDPTLSSNPQLDENCCESSSLLISCSLFLQEEQNLPCQVDTLPLTLGDVELTFT